MAKEITTKCTCSIQAAGSSKVGGDVSFNDDVAGGFVAFRQNIGTTAEQIILPADVAAPKVIFIQNLEAPSPTAKFVEIAGDALVAVWPQRLLPGTAVIIRPGTGSVYAKAETGATAGVNIWVVAG